ncbi:MAG: TolC family protein [Planctomycetaceae bacterium]|jgi:outer membrane protein TolC|nr:TolC family protein [Planctomycetaceae bacterium]
MKNGWIFRAKYCFCFIILFTGCYNGSFRHFIPYHQWFVTHRATAEPPLSESLTQTLTTSPTTTEGTAEQLPPEQQYPISFEQVFQKIESASTEDIHEWNNAITRPTMSTHYIDSIFQRNRQNENRNYSSYKFSQTPVSNRENEFLHTVLQKNGQVFKLNLSGAISLGLSHNPDLRSNRLQPSITETKEAIILSNFDPQLQTKIQGKNGNALYGNSNGYYPPRRPESSVTTDFGIQKYFTSGGTLGINGSFDNSHEEEVDAKTNTVTDTISIQLQQHLLNGGGFGVNLADVRQARLHTLVSQYEFRAYVQNFVAQIELAGWDYIAAARTLDVAREMYALTEQNWKETVERINNGIQPAADRFSFVSQLSRQESQLVKANCDLETARIALMQLIIPHTKEYWNSDLDLLYDLIPACDYLMNSDGHIELAKRNRPDIAQARLQIRSGQLDVLKTTNGLLPKLDFFMSVNWMGYAAVVNPQTLSNETAKKDDLSTTIGLSLEHQLSNRSARANDRAARLTLVQQRLALDNLIHLAESDVYKYYTNVMQSLKIIQHSVTEVTAAQSMFEAENERMKNGQSTAFTVAQAQNQWSQARYQEITNAINFRKNLVYLYLTDGSLLERRGIYLGRMTDNH